MNRISLKKLNEGLQAEFSTIANNEKARSKSKEISSGSDNNEVSGLIDWIDVNKDIYNNF